MAPVVGRLLVMIGVRRALAASLCQFFESEILEAFAEPSNEMQVC